MTEKMQLYMITLQGQGDTEVKLVRQDGWDALDNGVFSPELRAEYLAQYGSGPYNTQSVEEMNAEIDSFASEYGGSSPDNDVALSLPGATVDGQVCFWQSISEATAFLRAHPEIEILEEYEGYIY